MLIWLNERSDQVGEFHRLQCGQFPSEIFSLNVDGIPRAARSPYFVAEAAPLWGAALVCESIRASRRRERTGG